ncbi:alkaline-shock protein [Deinococcus aetherius]|uniref:Alkaline-shock protein n=1 Tax=Deinococcus aetherius TaxID=200252 RepID=A0ABN6RFU6_9DEIO|nr:Asp23/Gls24 family envelope stress response protein [Deinococcus aetherius]BDP41529.1 alkaline-shock protein [Deinococcus aetherius]
MEVEISRSVLTDIAQTTLDGIEGIEVAPASLRPSEVGEALRQQGGGPRRPRALRVTRDGQNVTVDVGLNVEYGRNLVGVARQAQQAVCENVELMTGLKVRAVNVTVLGVTLPKGNA